jgi:hypothetical protein
MDGMIGLAEVDDLRGQAGQAGVVVFDVVPLEEPAAERARLFQRREAGRKARAVLQRLELALGERVVVGDMRAAAAPASAPEPPANPRDAAKTSPWGSAAPPIR